MNSPKQPTSEVHAIYSICTFSLNNNITYSLGELLHKIILLKRGKMWNIKIMLFTFSLCISFCLL